MYGGSLRIRPSNYQWIFIVNPGTLSLIGIIAMLFATGLASVTLHEWDLGQKLWLAVCYLTIVRSLILIRCLL